MFDVTIEAEARLNACPVCSSSRLKQLATPPKRWIGSWLFEPYRGKLGLNRCTDCELVFVNPRPSSRLLSAFYKSERYVCHKLDDPESMLAKADHVLGRVEHHVPNRGVLLDFGCGSGWLIERARQRGWEALGFDVGDTALRHCRDRGLPVVDSLDRIGDASCDAIVLHHVLEHVERFDELFDVLKRMLKPGGRLFVEVPNADSLRARLSPPALSRYLAADERYRAFPIHLSYFSGANLSLLMQRFGFRGRAVETYGLGLDEYFYNADSEHTAYAGLRSKGRSPLLRPIRELIKRGLYGLRLGENLLVIAERPQLDQVAKQGVAA
jgi:SAM-dependent methyltransferase